jgi:1-deoxy-D-xylulose-5-phosphate reductoisomerase
MKRILILGSTGSIGVNTLKVLKELKDKYTIEALTVNSNIDLLEKQIHEYLPNYAVVVDEQKAKELQQRIGNKCRILSGEEGLVEATKNGNYDILLSALVGFAGLRPTIESIKRGKRIALANKETLVVAGELIVDLCKQYGAELIPVDSEHSAIFQCLVGEDKSYIQKLILTASGGPFLHKSKDDLKNVNLEEALDHPNWKMGNKITIDSATMMNKGLEVIEAHWLFGLNKENIDVVIHPQSIIHSFVEFIDGSIKAQLSVPDMKLPIQYALSYPDRFNNEFTHTNLPKLAELTFYEPDYNKFECLKLAYDVMEEGGISPCILNAANEVAVSKFLQGNIKFLQIPETINKALLKFENHKHPDLETIYETDRKTREYLESTF